MQLTKHHGLANDFLVVLDEVNGRGLAVDGELAVRLCDRRTGVGADGLIHGALPAPGSDEGIDVVMHLFNADGSRAEMSGNGIRCLAQALATARDVHEAVLHVATDVGVRRLQVEESDDHRSSTISVEMGPAGTGPDIPPEVDEFLAGAEHPGTRAATVDMGNPHLVVVVPDPAHIDLASEGPWLEKHFADGINVEFIAPAGPDTLVLRVWERGAGITQACGTGACAAAHVAHRWGLVGERVRVDMPGGSAEVELGPTVTLIGPSTHVATIEIPDA
ncbi:MAG: diaminopimelate epimerase [Acidimicrobiales bacterium]